MNLKNKSRVIIPFTAFIGLMFIVVCFFVFQSCEKNKDDLDYKLSIPDEYNQVGKLHNQGLDHVFNTIKEKHIENIKESEHNLKSAKVIDYNAIVTEATLDFCRTNKKLKENFSICEASVLDSKKHLKSAKLNSDIIKGLSSKQQQLFGEIKEALKVKFTKQNLKKLKVELDQINLKASRELADTEAAPIYCATSTAYCTYQYWHKNYKKWYFALHYPEILQLYNNEQLNNLSVKNGELSLKSATGWWDNAWDSVEDWWDDGTNAVSEWWDDNGSDIINADAAGAAAGVLYAIDSGIGTVSMVFGPEGWVLTVVGAGTSGAVYSSAVAAIWPF